MNAKELHKDFHRRYKEAGEKPESDYAMHCIGITDGRVYARHGKLFYKPYRNYYCTNGANWVWELMIEKGYASRDTERNPTRHYYYRLTRKGMDWLGALLNTTIYDEED